MTATRPSPCDRTADRRASHRPSQPDRHEVRPAADPATFASAPRRFPERHRPGRPWGPQQPGLHQHLEAVADAEHRSRCLGCSRKLVGEPGAQLKRQTTTGTECVAVAELLGQEDRGVVMICTESLRSSLT